MSNIDDLDIAIGWTDEELATIASFADPDEQDFDLIEELITARLSREQDILSWEDEA